MTTTLTASSFLAGDTERNTKSSLDVLDPSTRPQAATDNVNDSTCPPDTCRKGGKTDSNQTTCKLHACNDSGQYAAGWDRLS